jgi:hypothetical protein
MHGSAWHGDGAKLLLTLADALGQDDAKPIGCALLGPD